VTALGDRVPLAQCGGGVGGVGVGGVGGGVGGGGGIDGGWT
jgi:hypothetical protein